MSLKAPNTPRLEGDAEVVRREHELAIRELQGRAGVQLDVIPNVELADGVPTPVAHGLGRLPRWVRESCVRGGQGAGRIDEVRGPYDRTKVVVITASGFGATVFVDLAVA